MARPPGVKTPGYPNSTPSGRYGGPGGLPPGVDTPGWINSTLRADGLSSGSRLAPLPTCFEPHHAPPARRLQPPSDRARKKERRLGPEARVRRPGERARSRALPSRRPLGRLAGDGARAGGRLGGRARRRLPGARVRPPARPPRGRGGQGFLRGVRQRHPLAPLPRPAGTVQFRPVLLVRLPAGQREVRRQRPPQQPGGGLHLGAGLPAHPRRRIHPP